MSYKESVFAALKTVIDPWMGIDYVAARMAKVDEDEKIVKIELGYPARNMLETVKGNVEVALKLPLTALPLTSSSALRIRFSPLLVSFIGRKLSLLQT